MTAWPGFSTVLLVAPAGMICMAMSDSKFCLVEMHKFQEFSSASFLKLRYSKSTSRWSTLAIARQRPKKRPHRPESDIASWSSSAFFLFSAVDTMRVRFRCLGFIVIRGPSQPCDTRNHHVLAPTPWRRGATLLKLSPISVRPNREDGHRSGIVRPSRTFD